MTTTRDLRTIQIIRIEKQKAKYNHENIAESLGGGEHAYYTAINAVISAGSWGFASKFLFIVIILITMIMASVQNTIETTSIINTASLLLIITIPSITLALLSRTLETTPEVCLASAIVNLLFELCIFPIIGPSALGAACGIISVTSIVFQIIAICKWASYRRWFKDIDVEAYYKKSRRKA